MTILDKILREKQREVQLLRRKTFNQTSHSKVMTFREMINETDKMGIIAEIKRASPSKGMINADVNPVEQARQYEASGAQAISVLTDQKFFKGSMDDLSAVREAVNLPLLCKDFMIDKIQIDQAKAAGANLILLIAAALNDEQLTELFYYSKENDLEVLCEVHNEEEMERVLKLGAKIIGINNRDLKTFTVDLNTTKRLANMVTDPDVILVSESGIKSQNDCFKVAKNGARAILVGETFMRTENVKDTFSDLQIPLEKYVRP